MLVRESLARDLARLVVWYPLRGLIRLCPVGPAVLFLRALGRLHAILRPRALDDLAGRFERAGIEGFGPDWRRAEARRYLENHYVDRLHIFLFPRLARRDRWRRLLRLQGLQHVRDALAAHGGCVIVHAHYGPIQLPLFGLAGEGLAVQQIGLLVEEGFSWIGRRVAVRLRARYEACLPAEIVRAGSYLRPVFRHLAGGGLLMITGDGAGGGRRVGRYREVSFLGGRRAFPEGPAAIAKRAGVPLLPAFAVPDKEGFYKFVIGRPLALDRSRTEVTDADAAAFPAVLEQMIERWPGLWHFWDDQDSPPTLGGSEGNPGWPGSPDGCQIQPHGAPIGATGLRRGASLRDDPGRMSALSLTRKRWAKSRKARGVS